MDGKNLASMSITSYYKFPYSMITIVSNGLYCKNVYKIDNLDENSLAYFRKFA